ncbi:hypothetical protein D3C86_1972350 [compost metagenome]
MAAYEAAEDEASSAAAGAPCRDFRRYACRIYNDGRRADDACFLTEVPEYFLEPKGELHAERVHLCLCRKSAAESAGAARRVQPQGH